MRAYSPENRGNMPEHGGVAVEGGYSDHVSEADPAMVQRR
jgi:hypothetical protein